MKRGYRLAATGMMLVACAAARGQAPSVATIRAERVATGLSRPVYVAAPPGDYGRIFIVEQTGRVVIVEGGETRSPAFLNLESRVLVTGSPNDERGLLGLAFHPDYALNGQFYVNYTDDQGDTVIERYLVSNDPNVADADGAQVVLRIEQPYLNHNGGWMGFGPDGYLYVATGDGGGRNDPNNRAQTLAGELLGKMLRIDINGDAFPDDEDRNYAVPPDNPYVGVAGAEEVWALGLRNPWRCSFDRATGDLYIPDVGQEQWEEINFQPAGAAGGANYGWRCMEGDVCSGLDGCSCDDPTLSYPLYVYGHDVGCSITGGYVYRGCAIPSLRGAYLFADFCAQRVWSLRHAGGGVVELLDRTEELAPQAGRLRWISSFGEDAYGELYLCAHRSGEVFKIVPRQMEEDCDGNGVADACELADGSAADANGDGSPDHCEAPPVVVASTPPDGAIDARDVRGFEDLAGWQEVRLIFDRNINPWRVSPADFAMVSDGDRVPQVVSVDPAGEREAAVRFDRPTSTCVWTTLHYLPTGQTVRLGVVPGDVNADGSASVLDILDLINALNGLVSWPPWSTDINRSGATEPSDITRLVDVIIFSMNARPSGTHCSLPVGGRAP